ncbi:MAG: cephalosporin-C deacetylase-like acetyl esterase [Verrucomicrobiales bacterium]
MAKMKALNRLLIVSLLIADAAFADPLAGTKPLDWEGDIASRLVDSADAFLLKKIEEELARGGPADLLELKRMLGVVDRRVPFDKLEILSTVAESDELVVKEIRWPAFADVHGEGLLVQPIGKFHARVIVIPDADETPEMVAGLVPGVPKERQTARILAEGGCQVLVPMIINRELEHHTLSNREFIYRPAFELGRHIIGYEIQKVLALLDWMEGETNTSVMLSGHGEGGMLAYFAAALDERVSRIHVSGYAGPGADLWQEPAYRNVFGLLKQFNLETLDKLITRRRPMVLDPNPGPAILVEPGKSRGKPGRLLPEGRGEGNLSQLVRLREDANESEFTIRNLPDAKARHKRQLHELDRHNQQLLVESPYVRKKFMGKLDTKSPEAFAKSQDFYRDYFSNKVVGRFDDKLLPPNARTREIEINDKVRGYEVALDVFEDASFFAYGILLVPNDIKEGESRPCVVCQHGLEGRPQSTIGEEDAHYYKSFATKLAERGFVTFAPQNLYIFTDRFRSLQFKANSIGRTLFSLMVPQHQQITDWLGDLDFVDAQRIGFYGLSYGGKSAMRIPPLVDNYCLSICSADFNDWVWKNASTRSPYSYVRTGEYEIFEFDLGSTFNYSEMAALIAPRPFMVERGHFDGVAPDERVALEFAKVRHLYSARLGIGDRTEIEWFVGPHTINSRGTYDFLHQHLDWRKPGDDD